MLFLVLFLSGIALIIWWLAQSNDWVKSSKYDDILTLARQSARYATAADQDENPMIAVLHANYGTGYLWALGDIGGREEFEKATGLNYTKFRDEVVAAQERATKKAILACPKFAPKSTYLTAVAGEGV